MLIDEYQKRREELRARTRQLLAWSFFTFFVGLACGYAWRMAQGF